MFRKKKTAWRKVFQNFLVDNRSKLLNRVNFRAIQQSCNDESNYFSSKDSQEIAPLKNVIQNNWRELRLKSIRERKLLENNQCK